MAIAERRVMSPENVDAFGVGRSHRTSVRFFALCVLV